MGILLNVKNLTMRFGGLTAVNDLSFTVDEGTIHAIIGPNGAGKTTAFNAISKFFPLTAGEIWLGDVNITHLRADQIAEAGITRTFQNIRLFKSMTVLENVLQGLESRMRAGFFPSVFRLPAQRREEAEAKEKAMAALDFMGLKKSADLRVGSLAYGARRKVEIARALVSEPKLILLDEPAAGMNPKETTELMALISKIRTPKRSVLLIEHDLRLALGVSEKVVVLNFGKKIADGTPAEIKKEPAVIEAYLGKEVETNE